jgi:HPt (histidine-containing phosphotransfer) domain-containing protein
LEEITANEIFEAQPVTHTVPTPAVKMVTRPLPPAWLQVSQGLLNLEAAMPRFAYDLPFFVEMFQEFCEKIPERIQELNAALAADDALQLQRLSHNLKGVAANFGAEELFSIALDLESSGRQGNLSGAQSLVDRMAALTGRLNTVLEELRQLS